MNTYSFTLCGIALHALGSGALFWSGESTLVVSDLHLGKSERIARRGGAVLPPYETADTLARLETDVTHTGARNVVCLGDSFDDLTAADGLREEYTLWIARLQAGRRWTWIEGNHDPGPIAIGGKHLSELKIGPLSFRHIAVPAARGEVSGHYHPKASLNLRGRSISRPAFLLDRHRLILPAYGTYTGGLRSSAPALARLMTEDAHAILTGQHPVAVPMPR